MVAKPVRPIAPLLPPLDNGKLDEQTGGKRPHVKLSLET